MTNDEAKQALIKRTPVIYNGIKYRRIKELVYWVDDNDSFHISATLLDKNRHSTVRPEIKDVTPTYDK